MSATYDYTATLAYEDGAWRLFLQDASGRDCGETSGWAGYVVVHRGEIARRLCRKLAVALRSTSVRIDVEGLGTYTLAGPDERWVDVDDVWDRAAAARVVLVAVADDFAQIDDPVDRWDRLHALIGGHSTAATTMRTHRPGQRPDDGLREEINRRLRVIVDAPVGQSWGTPMRRLDHVDQVDALRRAAHID